MSAEKREKERLLDRLDHPPQKPHRVGTVDRAVVVRERQRQELAWFESPLRPIR
jgi:hypothetical protein